MNLLTVKTKPLLKIGTALAAGALGLLALAGCQAGDDLHTTTSAELSALEAVGIAPADVDPAPEPTASASAKPDRSAAHDRKGDRKGDRRAFLRKNILHGEAVVQTKDGAKTIDVQRGAVTAIDATSMTVKSTDGFTLTWKLGAPLRVVEHRQKATVDAVKVGTAIAVVGEKTGSDVTAHLIVIPATK